MKKVILEVIRRLLPVVALTLVLYAATLPPHTTVMDLLSAANVAVFLVIFFGRD